MIKSFLVLFFNKERLVFGPKVLARHSIRVVVLAGIGLAWPTAHAVAQSAYDQSPAARALGGASAPGGSGAPGGSSGFGPRGDQATQGGSEGPMPELKPTVAPRQRLDAGALLCHTEAQLRQHQAAMRARMAGQRGVEAGGCHIVGETQAVSVLARDGQAATQVRIAGEGGGIGWTDAVIREAE